MPYISTEALVGAALLVIVTLGYQYIPIRGRDGSTPSKTSKKKNKKKAKGNVSNSANSDGQGGSTTTPAAKGNGPAVTEESGAAATKAAAPVSGTAAKPKTLAQKIAPQPRKTKVDE